jgi:hypothetical protein
MRSAAEMMNDTSLKFNLGDILAYIDDESDICLCEIIAVESEKNEALVRFETDILARYVSLHLLYNL